MSYRILISYYKKEKKKRRKALKICISNFIILMWKKVLLVNIYLKKVFSANSEI